MDTPFNTVLSYEPNNVMLAALLSLILVVVFVILLHIYARCYLAPVPIMSDGVSASAPIVPLALGARFYRLHNLWSPDNTINSLDTSHHVKGLTSSVISSIPRFVYKVVGNPGHGLVCVICLSLFGDNEVGRKLQSCGHAFHVECIDMWLFSHATCPICRAPAVKAVNESSSNGVLDSSSEQHEVDVGVGVVVDGISDGSRLTEIVIETTNIGNDQLNDRNVSKTQVSSNHGSEIV